MSKFALVETMSSMMRELELAAAAVEREHCALEADDAYTMISTDKSYVRGWHEACQHISAEIRARGKK